jgi:hypothetical protein
MAQKSSWSSHPILAGIVGVFAGGLTIMVVEVVGHQLFGTATPADLNSVTMPMFASVLVAWIAGAAVAGFVATRWTGGRTRIPGLVGGLVLLAGSVMTMMALPHPVWMAAGAVVLMPAAAWLTSTRRLAPPA